MLTGSRLGTTYSLSLASPKWKELFGRWTRSELKPQRYLSKDIDGRDGKKEKKTEDSKEESDGLDDIFDVTVKQEDQEAAEKRAKEARERKPKSDIPAKPEIPKQVEEQILKEFEKAVSGNAAQSIVEKYGLTKHHINVLSACSVSTQRLHAGPVEKFGPIPIEKRVIGYIHLDVLDAPVPVKAAIRRMTGQHYKGDFVKLACEKYPTSIENLVHVIWTMETIVRTAKETVGIQVDRTPLSSWSEIMNCVESIGYGKQTIDYLNMSYDKMSHSTGKQQ
ncbi:hypothetical protein Gasu2_13260 [Galdieria sulphuraria]|uniref:Uncharacterized protein n=1 Tax=Galdieria sulphuraria TaxID=130081 RepID=M2WY73_GALSU|nr:uncharacterized protein Gasu_35710 [Galdieria sulphuraria]EME29000.1 hypothetical protein Gasu_35710 [Galdieria sulphuraria]GJD06938.1 hypothetical protein Gasu2_13260 [Galdieria sulphuraria]|eukprot:XP_005705520.1 hypothetical protein Gasu_35710 [Galdieria sulphuraria]